MKNVLQTVFFDVGGTLVFAEDLHDAFLHEWQTEVPKRSFYEALSLIKNDHKEKFRDVKTLLSVLCAQMSRQYGVKDLSERAAEIYKSVFLDSVSLYPGVEDTLSLLKDRGISMIITSDADADILRPQLQKLRIEKFFDKLLISSEVRAYKPSDTFVKAVDNYCPKDRAGIVMVGDSRDDVLTADKLGIASVLIDPQCTNVGTSPHFTIPQFKSLGELLNDVFG